MTLFNILEPPRASLYVPSTMAFSSWNIYMYISKSKPISISLSLYMYMYISLSLYMYTYMYICIYTHVCSRPGRG